MRFSLLRGRISGLVTWFDLLQDNVTRADPGQPGYFVQESGLRSTGLEASLNGRINDQWLVIGTFADTDARDDRTGLSVPLAPRFRFTMFNRYNVKAGTFKGLGFGVGAIYTGERALTRTSARGAPDWGPLPDVWRIDASLSYKYTPRNSRISYQANLNVQNVADRTDLYYLAAWDRATIDPGRMWRLSLGARF